jgi:hypothetical protein
MSNFDNTLLPSAVRNATQSLDLTNADAGGVLVVLDITAVPGVQTVQLKIRARDIASGKYTDLVADTAQVTTGTRKLACYPAAAAAPAAVDGYVALPLPRSWNVQVVHSGAGNFTYSVGFQMLG